MSAAKKKSSSSKEASRPSGGGFKISPRDIWQMFVERWWIGLLAALPCTVGVFLMAPDVVPLYTTSTLLLFETKSSNALTAVVRSQYEQGLSPSDINNRMEELRSQVFFEWVLTSFSDDEKKRIQEAYRDPETPDAPLPSVAQVIRNNVRIFAREKTTIVGIQVENRSPDMASLIANRYAQRYLAWCLNHRKDTMTSQLVFLRGQVEDMRAAVEKAQSDLQQYRAKNNLATLGETQNVTDARYAKLSTSLVDQQTELLTLKTTIDSIEAFRTKGADLTDIPAIRTTGDVGALLQQIKDAQSARVTLGERYLRLHPKMLQNQALSDELKRRLQDSVDSAVKDFYTRYQLGKDAEAAIKEQLAATDKQIHELDKIKVEYGFLEEDANRKVDTLKRLSDKLNEEEIASQLENVNVTIFDPAKVPGYPSNLGRAQTSLIALGLGLVILVALPVGIGFLDTRIKSVSHIEDGLGETLLGAVKRMKGLAEAERAHVFLSRKDTALAESYRGVFSEIEIRSKVSFPKTLLITSSIPGEGKSLTSSNLAAVFAGHGRRTLLIDCDLRRPTLHRYFGISGDVGLTQWLDANVHKRPDATELPAGIAQISDRFDMLPGGGAARNPTEVLNFFLHGGLLAKLNQHYDLVILDTPPVAVFPDALLLARAENAELIYVCRFEGVRIGFARKAVQRVRDTGVHVLGVVLNQIPSRRVKAYGYEGYGAYDSRYYKAYSSPEASR